MVVTKCRTSAIFSNRRTECKFTRCILCFVPVFASLKPLNGDIHFDPWAFYWVNVIIDEDVLVLVAVQHSNGRIERHCPRLGHFGIVVCQFNIAYWSNPSNWIMTARRTTEGTQESYRAEGVEGFNRHRDIHFRILQCVDIPNSHQIHFTIMEISIIIIIIERRINDPCAAVRLTPEQLIKLRTIDQILTKHSNIFPLPILGLRERGLDIDGLYYVKYQQLIFQLFALFQANIWQCTRYFRSVSAKLNNWVSLVMANKEKKNTYYLPYIAWSI